MLSEYAEHVFKLSKPGKDGTTLREHLEQVEKSLGETPADLIPPEFPDELSHLWQMYNKIHLGRTHGMNGPNPLTWQDIQAWCNLFNTRLSSWEIDVVKKIDGIYIRTIHGD